MDTWDAITSRRNVRWFTEEPIDPDTLDNILEAGRRTPSSRNSQPWDFVVVVDDERLTELSRVWQGAGHVARSAATIGIVVDEVVTPRDRQMIQFDLGQAVMQMMIAAAGFGLGSAHAWVQDIDEAKRVLDLPEGKVLAWMVAFGHPSDGPLRPIRKPNRRPFDEVVHRETWPGH